jgi:hypothetical protein
MEQHELLVTGGIVNRERRILSGCLFVQKAPWRVFRVYVCVCVCVCV